MSRYAIKVSPSASLCTGLDLLAALEETRNGRAEPWRPKAVALVIPAGYSLHRIMLDLALIALITPIAWMLRPRKR